MLCSYSCNENKKENFINNKNIEVIPSSNDLFYEFDREKFSLVQEGILLNLDGKYLGAIEKFNEAELVYGEMIQIYLNRGMAYSSIDNLTRAEIDFTKCIKLDSLFLPPYLNRGLIYTHSGRAEKGILDFSAAIRIRPSEPASYLNRAVAYRKSNKIDLACSDLKKAKSLGISEKYNSDMTDKMINELNCKK